VLRRADKHWRNARTIRATTYAKIRRVSDRAACSGWRR
jgi:hypothetical protein